MKIWTVTQAEFLGRRSELLFIFLKIWNSIIYLIFILYDAIEMQLFDVTEM